MTATPPFTSSRTGSSSTIESPSLGQRWGERPPGAIRLCRIFRACWGKFLRSRTVPAPRSSDRLEVDRLIATATGRHLEPDPLACFERRIPTAEAGDMDEHVGCPTAGDEAIALGGMERLHRTGQPPVTTPGRRPPISSVTAGHPWPFGRAGRGRGSRGDRAQPDETVGIGCLDRLRAFEVTLQRANGLAGA